jgi:hypothetical protein
MSLRNNCPGTKDSVVITCIYGQWFLCASNPTTGQDSFQGTTITVTPAHPELEECSWCTCRHAKTIILTLRSPGFGQNIHNLGLCIIDTLFCPGMIISGPSRPHIFQLTGEPVAMCCKAFYRIFPKRYFLALLGFTLLCLVFGMRTVFNLTIVHLVTTNTTNSHCPNMTGDWVSDEDKLFVL